MKATSIFGSVQVINIFISIVRSKFIALILGPIGIGISGMITGALSVVGGITNFGLGISAVKDISQAYESKNSTRISIIITVLRRWIWVTGIVGLAVTLLLSPLLSYISFGNWDYTIGFMALSVTLLLNQLTSGQLVILQGSRQLGYLAKANLLGSIIGLCTTIPIYYIYKVNGIIPAIIISSFVALIISNFFNRKNEIEKIKVSKIRSYAEGKIMLKMGFLISMSSFFTLGFSYLIRLFISHEGGLSQVGLYNAGFAIINTYVGIIFTAMGTDYFPRLSSVANNKIDTNKTINQQAEISLLILAPIIIAFIIFIKWVIEILYSKDFMAMDDMLVWAAFGMLFKSISWSIGYIFLAKGKSKLFFINELITNIYMFVLNMIGYYYWGLTGLGLSFLVIFLLHLLQMMIVSKKIFDFQFDSGIIRIASVHLIITVLTILYYYYLRGQFFDLAGIILLVCSLLFSMKELNQRINLVNLIKKKLH